MREPHAPSEAERRKRELTHVPFRSWRRVCVLARSKESPRRAQSQAERALKPVAVAQVDFCFPWGNSSYKVLCVVEVKTGYCAATVIQPK
eukprot:12765035-Alexandrium_andersonii.AAC.1